MSHKIRTPLNAVIGFFKVLENTVLDDLQRRCRNDVKARSDLLFDLVNDILDFSKIGAGETVLDEIEFDIADVVLRVFAAFRAQAESKNLSLESFIDGDTKLRLLVDPMSLRQILMNLVGNALKFTSKGCVTVGCVGSDNGAGYESITIFVVDTAKEPIEDVFQNVNQGGNSRSADMVAPVPVSQFASLSLRKWAAKSRSTVNWVVAPHLVSP